MGRMRPILGRRRSGESISHCRWTGQLSGSRHGSPKVVASILQASVAQHISRLRTWATCRGRSSVCDVLIGSRLDWIVRVKHDASAKRVAGEPWNVQITKRVPLSGLRFILQILHGKRMELVYIVAAAEWAAFVPFVLPASYTVILQKASMSRRVRQGFGSTAKEI
jgi:hypothetical protein